jgi:hypothetical protein
MGKKTNNAIMHYQHYIYQFHYKENVPAKPEQVDHETACSATLF